jgi:hypothetical protein
MNINMKKTKVVEGSLIHMQPELTTLLLLCSLDIVTTITNTTTNSTQLHHIPNCWQNFRQQGSLTQSF